MKMYFKHAKAQFGLKCHDVINKKCPKMSPVFFMQNIMVELIYDPGIFLSNTHFNASFIHSFYVKQQMVVLLEQATNKIKHTIQ